MQREAQSIHYIVPGFLSSRPNWVLPSPYPQASVASPVGSRGETHMLLGGGKGMGGPNSDETLVLYVYDPSTERSKTTSYLYFSF
jgi:hypothetical protein